MRLAKLKSKIERIGIVPGLEGQRWSTVEKVLSRLVKVVQNEDESSLAALITLGVHLLVYKCSESSELFTLRNGGQELLISMAEKFPITKVEIVKTLLKRITTDTNFDQRPLELEKLLQVLEILESKKDSSALSKVLNSRPDFLVPLCASLDFFAGQFPSLCSILSKVIIIRSPDTIDLRFGVYLSSGISSIFRLQLLSSSALYEISKNSKNHISLYGI